MSTSKTKSASPMAELSLDALDMVIGGNGGAPMGLGGSLAAPIPAIGNHAATGSASPTGYNDHFGISMGGATDAHAAAAGVGASHAPSPMGLGGSMPSGAGVNSSAGSDHGSTTAASGATGLQNTSDHAPAGGPGTGAGTGAGDHSGDHNGDPFGGAQSGQNASDHNSPEALGVNTNNAFNLVDSAAQDAIAILHGEQIEH